MSNFAPMRLGSQGRDLFALYLPASVQTWRSHGIVVCNPFGQEAIRSHRLHRVLCERLVAAGFDVLRFDYFGTGDSAGEHAQGDLASWVDDIASACDALRSRSACRDLSLFGMRLGANLALRAAMRMPVAPQAVLLWDPLLDGASYLQLMRQAHQRALEMAFGARWSIDADLRAMHQVAGQTECLGFEVTPRMREELATMSLRDDIACLGREGFSCRVDVWSAMHDILGDADAMLRTHALNIEIDWMTDEALNTPIAPIAMVQQIVEVMGDAADD